MSSNVCSDNQIMPCCQFRKEVDVTDNNFQKTFLGSEYTQIRNSMLAGEKISECRLCYTHEEAGMQSLRLDAIRQWGTVTEPLIKFLEIEFDNVCNLKCRGCGSGNSHSWFNDEIALYGETLSDTKYKYSELYETIDFKNIEEIRLYGGEPFLSERCEKFCKQILNQNIANTIKLQTSTNGTILPRKYTHDLLMSAKELTLTVSIDGYGKINEYFRSGTDFNIVINNLKEYINIKNRRAPGTTNIRVHTVVSIYNVNVLEEFDNFMKLNFPDVFLTKECLQNPPWLAINNIPLSYKNKIKPSLKNYPEILKFLNSDGVDLFDHFLNFHYNLDSIRNENLEGNDLLAQEIYNKKSKSSSKEYFLTYIKDLKNGNV